MNILTIIILIFSVLGILDKLLGNKYGLGKELEKGLPIIVFSHDPIWDRMLKHTAPYHPNVRLTEKDYKASHEMIDLILNNPLVITTFAGHNHKHMEMEIDGKIHYSTKK